MVSSLHPSIIIIIQTKNTDHAFKAKIKIYFNISAISILHIAAAYVIKILIVLYLCFKKIYFPI